MRYFTHYWANDTALREAGNVLSHTCGEGCDEVDKGDIVYAVTVMDGILHPLGRMVVGAVTDQRGAEMLLDDNNLWEAEWHLVAEPGSSSAVKADAAMPLEQAKELVVLRKSGPANPKLDPRGVLDRQTLRNVCEITPESARLLDSYIESTDGRSLESVAAAEAIGLGSDLLPLAEKLRQIGSRQGASTYLDLCADLIVANELTDDDPRLVMSLPAAPRLSLIFNQRHVLVARLDDLYRLGFIIQDVTLVSSAIDHSVESFEKKYKQEVPPSFIRLKEFAPEVLSDLREPWMQAAQAELTKAKSSPFGSTHSSLFYQTAVDAKTREAVLRVAFDNTDPEELLAEMLAQDLESRRLEDEEEPVSGLEGAPKQILVSRYERDDRNRLAAIKHHGTACQVCGFDFTELYGEHGKGYIEVHHTVPLSSYGGSVKIDAVKDLAVLCANCHRMVHRDRNNPLSVNELKTIVLRQCGLMHADDRCNTGTKQLQAEKMLEGNL